MNRVLGQENAPAKSMSLEAALAALARVTHERDLLRASHEELRLELAILKRRLFVAKAERVDTAQLELEFAAKLAELNRLADTPKLGPTGDSPRPEPKKKPTGRRDLSKSALEEERVEINDPVFEALVAAGKAERIGHEEDGYPKSLGLLHASLEGGF